MRRILLVMLLIPIVFSQTLPKNLQEIKEYNKGLALDYVKKISFPVAFIAGSLSILSPCILPLIPAFFTYTFKERQDISKMTIIFFIGFSIVFTSMGIIVGYIGSSLAMFQQNITPFIRIAGIFLVIMGVLTLLGRGFSSFIKVRKKPMHDVMGIFLFGMFFALGWSACLGPILSGILMIAGILQNYMLAGLLLFVYSAGIFLPLFIISFFFDQYKLGESRWIQGWDIKLNGFQINSIKLISGLLFILVGFSFMFLGNTAFVNTLDIFGTKQLFYDYQNRILQPSTFVIILGFLATIFLVFIILKPLKKVKPVAKQKNKRRFF